MNGAWREYWPAVGFSLAVHAAIVLAVIFATNLSLHRTSEILKPLGIDAVVIDARSLRPSAPPAAPAPAPAPVPAPEPVHAAPAVSKAVQENLQREAQAAQAALAKQRIADAQAEAARAAATAAAAQKATELQRAAEAQKAADAQKVAEAQKVADARRAADAKARADREAELRRQLADEEHVHDVENGPLAASYNAALVARITRAWIQPPTARPGIDCRVEVTQVPGGEVVGARVTQCNGDAAVRQSIENAVLRSSPLPDPPDPALFHRVFTFEFKPNE